MEKITVVKEIHRPVADFPANIWEDPLTSLCNISSDLGSEANKEKLNVVKEQVKEQLMASKANPIENINFIDLLCRLGVSYHFEKEIEEQLDMIFGRHEFNIMMRDHEHDLRTVGIIFQVLRQFGYKLSSDVFEKFKDEEGKFKEHLGDDTKTMLSLYEAAQWSTHGEDILEEALVFSRYNLERLASRSSPHVARRIENALKHPYPRGIPRIEARQYISYYQEEVPRNERLLEFAKLDFDILQQQHREELAHFTRWYNDMEIETKVPYSRKRIVEAYLWAVGTYFEPQHSRARIISATTIILLTLLDDTYDAFGTFEELGIFTDALNRWLPSAPHELPDSMKYAYHCIVDFYNKVEEEMEDEGRSGCGFHLKNAIKTMVKSYYQEAKWLNEDYVATFDEYKENGVRTSGYQAVVAASFAGIKVAKLDVFEWLTSHPKILLASETLTRLTSDIVGYEFERKRKHLGTSIDCYMKQYGVSKDKAIEDIHSIALASWKDMNEELMRPHCFPFPILAQILNLVRVIEVFYKHQECYTNPKFLKDYVVALFAQSITI